MSDKQSELCPHGAAYGSCDRCQKFIDFFKPTGLESENAALREQLAEAEEKVYVPGLWRCAKCKLDLMATLLGPAGHAPNTAPQTCPNRCGPMWRVTERDQRKEAQGLFEREFDARQEAERKLADAYKSIRKMNDQAEHFEREYYLAKMALEDAHDAARREAAGICGDLEDFYWRKYKSDDPSSHTEGKSDGAQACAAAILARLGQPVEGQS